MNSMSYAQNREDLVLARVLADVVRGSYVDVGAQDPRVDSVTCAFYERGWRGINIEPVQHWHRRLLAARPDDLNLCLAAGDHAGTLRLYEVQGTGLSTVRADLAARHRAAGLLVHESEVAVQTLDAIFAVAGMADVHFLKIDAAGAELEVLRGLSFRILRPWIVVVAAMPESRVPAGPDWEPALLGHDYDFAYDDGNNRFYLAREHADLAGRFGPSSALDDFARPGQLDNAAMLESRPGETAALLQSKLKDATARILAQAADLSSAGALAQRQQLEVATLRLAHARLSLLVPNLEAELHGAERANAAMTAEILRQADLIAALQAEHSGLMGSRSWRLTAPLRALRLPMAAASDVSARSARSLARNRLLRGATALALRPLPGLAARLKLRLYGPPAPELKDDLPMALTEDAERILRLAPVVPAPKQGRG